ncbi:SHOCT domain-containing protein [Frankia sp. R82]|uniref:SHOCT domain-containing protein n=1 Tax=Frankia sp. R82 TaxID=2950553 RepID=UPI002042EB0C|nr:SHOCT domain-containing protein [Frankia sp. R82]MCM3884374.1 SHOCT domain-containing protein [Frankia sp. R82]
MRRLSAQGEQAVADLADRYGVSTDAVRTLLAAVLLGNGSQAQFTHPELGGSGQWMAGGMTMIGDMFNTGLQAKVSGLAAQLSALLASTELFESANPAPPTGATSSDAGFAGPAGSADSAGFGGSAGSAGSAGFGGSVGFAGFGGSAGFSAGQPGGVRPTNLGGWWPGELGQPSSSGSQNDSRYAVFPGARRLVVQRDGGPVRIYDTGDCRVGGVQQQQGGRPGTLVFTSQHGTFAVDSLPLAGPAAPDPSAPPPPAPAPAPAPQSAPDLADPARPVVVSPPGSAAATGVAGADVAAEAILATIERLGDLHQRGLLTDAEFAAKKAELLARL